MKQALSLIAVLMLTSPVLAQSPEKQAVGDGVGKVLEFTHSRLPDVRWYRDGDRWEQRLDGSGQKADFVETKRDRDYFYLQGEGIEIKLPRNGGHEYKLVRGQWVIFGQENLWVRTAEGRARER